MPCKKYVIIATSIKDEYNKAADILGPGWEKSGKDFPEVNRKEKKAQENIHFKNQITGEQRTLRFDVSSFFFAPIEQKIEMAADPEEKQKLQEVDGIVNQLFGRIIGKKKDAN